ELAPQVERWIANEILDRDAWSKAGQAGLLLADVPTEYGGGGGDFAHEVVILEEAERSGVGPHMSIAVHSTIVSPYILKYGSDEQKQRWLPEMASGRSVAAIAMTEPGTGSDLQGVQTKAVRDGNGYRINGQKTFISNGQHADLILVVARTGGEGAKGVSLIMVDARDAEGFRRGRNLEKIGQKGADTSELFFDDVWVPADNLLGAEEGEGFYQLMNQLPRERLSVGVIAVAAMERAIELTVDYVKSRTAFGKAIIDFQNTQFKLAECKTEAHIARVFVDNCIERYRNGELDNETASMVKWWTTEKQCEIIDTCVQLHGGYGYMLEYPIARMYTDARVQKIYGGTNEIMKVLIGRSL
ncbi:MAG: acyl-CoA dehydrogenase family protein, partial [Gammaproteobacteria bacterium]|nr:acyl-CoA dehydrogenase family protein [Gammaproteobacteria bacterium]